MGCLYTQQAQELVNELNRHAALDLLITKFASTGRKAIECPKCLGLQIVAAPV